jgi:cobalt-zinc-cadmium efflux system membrane fusion protein
VPEEAVVRYSNQQYVVQVTGKNSYQLVNVEAGVKENNRIAVSSHAIDLKNMPVVIKNTYAVLGSSK